MRPVVVLGGGGHGRVVLDALLAAGRTVLAVSDARRPTTALPPAVLWLQSDDAVSEWPTSDIEIANGVGAIDRRRTLFERFVERGYVFATVRHPSAIIAPDAILGHGAQVMAGAVVQPGCRIGSNVIVNTRSSLDHACIVGDHAHLAPGSIVCGDVQIGPGTMIGAGAVVIEGRRVGSSSIVGAGAVVIHDVPDNTRCVGVPARNLPRSARRRPGD